MLVFDLQAPYWYQHRQPPGITLLDDIIVVHTLGGPAMGTWKFIAHDRRTGERRKGATHQRYLPARSYGKVLNTPRYSRAMAARTLLDGQYAGIAGMRLLAVRCESGRILPAFGRVSSAVMDAEWWMEWQGGPAYPPLPRDAVTLEYVSDRPLPTPTRIFVSAGPTDLLVGVEHYFGEKAGSAWFVCLGWPDGTRPKPVNLFDTPYFRKPISGLWSMARSPDGALLAFGYPHRVDVVDAATGLIRRSYAFEGAALSFAPDGLVLAVAEDPDTYGNFKCRLIDLC